MSFADRLLAASEAARSLVCVGLDVDLERMPDVVRRAHDERGDGLPSGEWGLRDGRAVVEFNRAIVDATKDLVCAYKPNIAFYEALGLPGLRALEATVSHIREVAPGCVIICDAKRGDIGNTVEAYAKAFFDVWGVDAVTVNPWGGMDTIEPWLEHGNGGIIVWCRGSNPGAGDLQDLAVDGGEPVYMRLARELAALGSDGNLGIVVGATAPEQLAEVRAVCRDMPVLIPGVGAQGGDLEASVRNGVDAVGRLAIINSGRGIIYASTGGDFAEAARNAANELRDGINATLDAMGLGWG